MSLKVEINNKKYILNPAPNFSTYVNKRHSLIHEGKVIKNTGFSTIFFEFLLNDVNGVISYIDCAFNRPKTYKRPSIEAITLYVNEKKENDSLFRELYLDIYKEFRTHKFFEEDMLLFQLTNDQMLLENKNKDVPQVHFPATIISKGGDSDLNQIVKQRMAELDSFLA